MPTYNVTDYARAGDVLRDVIQNGNLINGYATDFLLVGAVTAGSDQIRYSSGIRFKTAKVPVGATITSATLTVNMAGYSTSNPGGPGKAGYVYGITGGSSNIPMTANAAGAPSQKPRTTAVAPLISVGTDMYQVINIDVTAHLTELINQPSWTDTSEIGFVLTPVPYDFPESSMELNGSAPNLAENLLSKLTVTYEYTPTLQTLTLFNNTVADTRPTGFNISDVIGITDGSTITVTGNTSGGRIDYNGTTKQIYVSGNLTGQVGQSYNITLTETLSGAIGSPKSTTFTISVVAGGGSTPPEFIAYEPNTDGDTTFNLPPHQTGDGFIAIVYSLNLSSAYPVISLPGWTKMTSTTNMLYAGMYGLTFDLFYRTSTGSSEPPSYTVTSTGMNTVVRAFSVRDQGDYIVAKKIGLAEDAFITWENVNAPADSLITLIGLNPAGAQQGQGVWNDIIPSGTTQPSNSVIDGVGVVYYTQAATGPTPTKTVASTQGIGPVSFTIAFEPSGPATLGPLSLSSNTVYEGSPSDTLIGAITGSKTGSTLEVVGNSNFKVIGTNLYTNATMGLPGTVSLTIRETLSGAVNSPNDTSVSISILEMPPLQFISFGTGSTTPNMPAHQAGDLLLIWMFRDGNTTAPALPSGFTTLNTGSGNTTSFRLAYRIATASGTSGGGATTATSCITHVYRPKTGYIVSTGAFANATASSTTVSYPALTLQDTSGSSWVGGFAGHRSTNTSLETPPAGMVLRSAVVDTTDEAAGFDTDGGVTSWTAKTVPVGGTSSGWISSTFEIKVTAPTPPTAQPTRYSSWFTQ